jgi:hypothetical protein
MSPFVLIIEDSHTGLTVARKSGARFYKSNINKKMFKVLNTVY